VPAAGWELVPGWFDETVPPLARRLRGEGIALLRLDGDWYESTTVCLEHLEPLVHEEGVIVIDDYYAWDGCARAVHDYLSRHDLPYRLRGIPSGNGAYVIKRAARTDMNAL
jgi:O-methyltransferase